MSEIFQALKKKIGPFDKLGKALIAYCENFYKDDAFSNLWDEMTKASGKAPVECTTPAEFLSPALMKSLSAMLGKAFAEDVRGLTDICCRGQFSTSVYRRSYRSRHFGYYAETITRKLPGWIRFACNDGGIIEMLKKDHTNVSGMAEITALEINRGNQAVIDLIREMILGDNNVFLSRAVIIGIIMSDSDELKALLMKLLGAAGRQEGLRQAILESADTGDTKTLIMILKTCLDQDMFRFSAAARAFYTFTGLYNENADIALTKRLAAVAYECLTDAEKRSQYRESDNPLEAYLAIWAVGCDEVMDTFAEAEKLICDEKKYRKLLGWYFVHHVENEAYRHAMAVKYLDDGDEEVIAYAAAALHYNRRALRTAVYNRENYDAVCCPDKLLPEKRADRYALFTKLKAIALKIGKKTWVFDPSLFPWNKVTLSNPDCNVIRCMMSLAACDLDQQMISELWELRECFSPYLRLVFYLNFLTPDKHLAHREYLYEGLKDRSPDNRKIVVSKLKACRTLHEDIVQVCDILRSKNASVKKSVVDYLKGCAMKDRLEAVQMLAKGQEEQVQAALELMIEDADLAEKCAPVIEEIRQQKLSSQTKLLLVQLAPEGKAQELSEENGYGLFDAETISAAVKRLEQPFDGLSQKEIRRRFPSDAELMTVLDRINAVFDAHSDYEYEYENYDGSRETVLFGNAEYAWSELHIPAEYGPEHLLRFRRQVTFDMIPFHEEFEAALKPWTSDPEKMVMLAYRCMDDTTLSTANVLPWFRPFYDQYACSAGPVVRKRFANRTRMLFTVIYHALQLGNQKQMLHAACLLYFSLCQVLGEENLLKPYSQNRYTMKTQENPAFSCAVFRNIRDLIGRLLSDDAEFSSWFSQAYCLEKRLGLQTGSFIEIADYLRALKLKLIPDACFYERALMVPDRWSVGREISQLTSKNAILWKDNDYEAFSPMIGRMVDNMVLFEAARGQAETALSSKVMQIRRYEGARYFCLLLSALGKEKFHRGYLWRDLTKNGVLSSLLRKCMPAKDDTPEKLKAYLAETDIREKRLVEAAMYAPQWAALVETVTGIHGLKKGIWFFHAHISEHFSSEKEAETAIYSPISPQRFNDGAFDVAWFKETHAELGEKWFDLLYKSAKYITEGSNAHRRSQLYVDAVTGKLEIHALEKEILEKRNQERLRAYGLIPVDAGDEKELLRRYEFIAAYMKEAKGFGAQRRESETKAGKIALENLAISCGVTDVNRLLWRLEKAKLEQIMPLTKKQSIGSYELYLEFDPEGNAGAVIEKGGKRLKSTPKELKKNALLEELKQTVKDLKEQRVRSRQTLEEAMTGRLAFEAEEIGNIADTVTIAPLIKALVWRTEDGRNGFIHMDGGQLRLTGIGGEAVLKPAEKLYIAHPYDLKAAGCWADYMHYAYEKRLVQPFKQIFRELYPITKEEQAERTVSRRYAGYQVQPRKTVALLRSRGWTVDYEEGLQKVSYIEQIIVRLYAACDWFSPADYEAPTLEQIEFVSRHDGRALVLSEVDPVLFSETMRDLDLAVSVAAVGGVDPETSHSTVEMRIAIARELVQMLKLKNVTFTERHARIAGKLAQYSVHMGSGVVHAMEKGMIPILAVHSQQRGRIFLPFADEDPKTAEIMSKIILLAEDQKIKDPTILERLR